MLRRDFLMGAASGAGVALLGLPGPADAVPAGQLLRFDPSLQTWQRFAAVATPGSERRLRLLGPQFGQLSDIQQLQLDLVFGEAEAAPHRHRAWRYVDGAAHGNSAALSLRLPEAGIDLELRVRRHSGPADAPALRLAGLQLEVGDYLLVLGTAAVPSAASSQLPALPAGMEAFRLQVVEEAPPPDLNCRADLACLGRPA